MLELGAADYFETLLIYILNEQKNISLEGLVEILDAEGREVVMSMAEQLRMEGEVKGIQKGREEGLKEGILKGHAEGKIEGKEEVVQNTAKRLLALDMEIEKIALATALPIEEVERIANKTK